MFSANESFEAVPEIASSYTYEDSDYAIETAVNAGFKVIKVIEELKTVDTETEI